MSIQPEDGTCNVFRNTETSSTLEMAYLQKPKLYVSLPCTQELVTGLYSKQIESRLHFRNLFLYDPF
jgi:hypothetical protein